jgi:hypothetical protein
MLNLNIIVGTLSFFSLLQTSRATRQLLFPGIEKRHRLLQDE